MDLRLEHVRERLRRKVALPTPSDPRSLDHRPSRLSRQPLLPTPSRPRMPPIQQPTQSTGNHPTRRVTTNSIPTTRRSQHPQFTSMVTEFNVTVRLLFGFDNWNTTFPQRLSTSLDNFVSAIQPPRRSQACTEQLLSATDTYKRHIKDIVVREIAATSIAHLQQLRGITADLHDWQLAADTVQRQLNRSHKHLIASLTQPVFNKLISFILDHNTSYDVLTRHFPTLMQTASANSNTNPVNDSDVFVVLSSTSVAPQPPTTAVPTANHATTSTPVTSIESTNIKTPPTISVPIVITASTTLPEETAAASAAVPAPEAVVSNNVTYNNVDAAAASTHNTDTANAAAAADNHPSIIDIILYSPEAAPVVDTLVNITPSTSSAHLPTSTPAFIIPRSPPFTASDLRRALPATPTASPIPCSSVTITPPLPQRLRPRTNRTAMPPPITRQSTQTTSHFKSSPSIPTQPVPSTSRHDFTSDRIRAFNNKDIDNWKVEHESAQFTTLVIADSNGKRWLDAPTDWVVYSFSGMKLADVANIIRKSPSIRQYERIIVHCGRNDSFQSVKQHVIDFVTFLHSIDHPQLFIVPSLPDPQLYETGLRLLRTIISEEFGCRAILFDEPDLFVRLNPHDTKHYSRSTAEHLIRVIVHHLN